MRLYILFVYAKSSQSTAYSTVHLKFGLAHIAGVSSYSTRQCHSKTRENCLRKELYLPLPKKLQNAHSKLWKCRPIILVMRPCWHRRHVPHSNWFQDFSKLVGFTSAVELNICFASCPVLPPSVYTYTHNCIFHNNESSKAILWN